MLEAAQCRCRDTLIIETMEESVVISHQSIRLLRLLQRLMKRMRKKTNKMAAKIFKNEKK
jgi:hypothetical protein